MQIKKIFYGLCGIALTAALLTGCGKTSDSQTTKKMVQVTSVDGNTITAQTGTLSDTMPDMPDMQKSGNTPPEKPEGNPPEQPERTPLEKPENNNESSAPPTGDAQPSEGTPPDKAFFEAGEETLTFYLNDDTHIYLEQAQNKTAGSTKDIVKDAILEITLDEKNTATEIIVRHLPAEGVPAENKPDGNAPDKNGFGENDSVPDGASVTTIDTDTTVSDKTYESSGDDENALRIDGAAVSLQNCNIQKTGGASSNTENGDFYGINAGLLATNGATVTISDTDVTTNAVNGNGIFCYGKNTTVNVSDSKIRTTQNNAGGIQTTGGGTMYASNLDIETEGNSSAAIRSDRGGGTVMVDGGTYTTNGTGSPAIYSTASITVKNSALNANASEGIVVEGKNSVALENCDVLCDMKGTYHGDSSENIHGIMLYQSMSGDAAVGEAAFSAINGSITAKTGDLFYITNTDCKIDLENVALKLANNTLLRVEGNHSSRGWGTQGANGGNVTMIAKKQTLEGEIIVDEISSLDLTLSENSSFEGTINPDGNGGTVNVTLTDTAGWSLCADAYISAFNGDISQVITNGFHLYVNGEPVL